MRCDVVANSAVRVNDVSLIDERLCLGELRVELTGVQSANFWFGFHGGGLSESNAREKVEEG